MKRSLLVLLACAFVAPEAALAVEVRVRNATLSPQQVRIARGEAVTWINGDQRRHRISSDTGAWRPFVLAPRGRKTIVLGRVGRFPYTVDGRAKGVVIVRAAAGPASAFPRTWAGSASGSLTGDGVTQTWSSQVPLVRRHIFGAAADYSGASNGPAISWEIAGTDSRGCSYAGEAQTGRLNGVLYLEGGGYSLVLFRFPEPADYPLVQITCPGQPPFQRAFAALHTPQHICSSSSADPAGALPFSPYQGRTIAGSRSYTETLDSPYTNEKSVFSIECTWRLTAGS